MNAIAETSNSKGMQTAARVERRLEQGIRDANLRLSRIDRDVQRFVRRKPLAAALTALAIGFVIGRLASKI